MKQTKQVELKASKIVESWKNNPMRHFDGMTTDGYIQEIVNLVAQAQKEAVEDFKNKVVKYALDELERDCLSSGLEEQTAAAIDRLRYWILDKEVTNRNSGESLTTKERNK